MRYRKFLDPKADIVFKKIFCEHPHLLVSFLNAVLPLSEKQRIVSLSYLPQEQAPIIPAFKRTIADVKCTDAQGRVFIVEMQINWTDGFKQRLLFGAGQAMVKQLEKGQTYNLLQPVYGLGLVAEQFDSTSEWYHHYQLVKKGNTEDLIEHLQLVFIELPKFPLQSPEHEQMRLLWLRFLREIDERVGDVSAELLKVPEISEAVSLSEEAAFTRAELEVYESYWDAVRTEKTLMSGSFSAGVAQGREEGKVEEKLAIAQKMLDEKIASGTIAKLTGLSKAAIDRLKKN